MGRIEIERKAGGAADRLRKYKVLVDDEQQGTIGKGETLTLEVAPGQHTVVLTIDWARSQELTADVPDGEALRLWCEPAANPLTALWYATFGRARYIRLRVDSSSAR